MPFEDGEGVRWDVGGQWVGPQQRRVHALLREYGIGTAAQHDDTRGKLVIVSGGDRCEYDAATGVYPAAFARCIGELDRLAAALPPEGAALFDDPQAPAFLVPWYGKEPASPV